MINSLQYHTVLPFYWLLGLTGFRKPLLYHIVQYYEVVRCPTQGKCIAILGYYTIIPGFRFSMGTKSVVQYTMNPQFQQVRRCSIARNVVGIAQHWWVFSFLRPWVGCSCFHLLYSPSPLVLYGVIQGDLAIYAAELPSQRVRRLFYLGMGLAKLLQVWCCVPYCGSPRFLNDEGFDTCHFRYCNWLKCLQPSEITLSVCLSTSHTDNNMVNNMLTNHTCNLRPFVVLRYDRWNSTTALGLASANVHVHDVHVNDV